MTEYHQVFLSYNREDRTAVDELAQALDKAHVALFKDDWYLRPGEHWPTTLDDKLATCAAVIVAVGRKGFGPWQRREVCSAIERHKQEREAGKPPLPIIPFLLDRGCEDLVSDLREFVWVERGDPRAVDLIVGALDGTPPADLYGPDAPDPRTRIRPYRGLQFFREEHAALYFGCEDDGTRLSDAVSCFSFVAVVGPSGSGKSSLVRAGLFPRLHRPKGDRIWQMVEMVPGREPFLQLARALLPLRDPEHHASWTAGQRDKEHEDLAERLERKGADHLCYVVRQIVEEKEPGTTHLLLLVDQWEELYTQRPPTADAAEAHAARVRSFIDMLLEATSRCPPLRVVLTLRADYWEKVLDDQPLFARLRDATVHLGALDRDALARIIRCPAAASRLTVPNDLTEVLLNDALARPGELPLLEFALEQLWGKRVGYPPALTLDDYRSIGGLANAIVTHAENAVVAGLSPEQRDALPGVFAALVQVEEGEGRNDLRRRAPLKGFSEPAQALVRRLADARLLVTGRDGSSGDEIVEVAHEALLRRWPNLGQWIEQRRGALLTIRQLQADARTWRLKGEDRSYEWSHERVREAVRALRQCPEERLTAKEQTFLGPIDPAIMLEELRDPKTEHHRRKRIGERLAVLGDPRPGLGVDANGTPEIDWCDVPAGEVVIETKRRLLPGTRQRCKRVEGFRIARYPVTVAQYRAFLTAKDGWSDPKWWGKDLYRDEEGSTYDIGRFDNYPAVYVSWFDAVAFCRWLFSCRHENIRLPDEWQWQQAATGGNAANIYPWGAHWDPKAEPYRANTFESRLGGPTAVGMYPGGASASVEAHDMAGTVWEWCSNKHDTPEVTWFRRDDFDACVVRGGSWDDDHVGARAAYRSRSHPNYRFFNVGFRVVCSSPIFGHGSLKAPRRRRD